MTGASTHRFPTSTPGSRPAAQNGRCTNCGEAGTLQAVAPSLGRCEVCGFLVALPRIAGPAPTTQVLTAALPLSPGTVLRERYRLVDLIGRGAHGLTFLAHHEFLNHPCVVKVLPYRVQHASDAAARRLRNEASAGFRVNHPNVVRVLDGDELDGMWYFVMEYVEGTDLSPAVGGTTRTDWRQVIRFLLDAAGGLEAIHAAGLVHRDVKPGNLLLGVDGRLRVADLGVVCLAHAQPRLTLVPGEGRDGTLAYAAPEVLADAQNIGPAADLYSLGATAFELLTGRPPRGNSVYRTLLAGGPHAVSWPEDAPTDIPDWLIETILRLLAPKPSVRFESAATLAAHLEQPAERPTATTSMGGTAPAAHGLAVLPFESESGTSDDDWLGHAVADHLARTLARSPEAYVVAADQFLETFEHIRARADRPRGGQLLEAGRLCGAARVVEGTFRRQGDAIRLAVRIHQVGQDNAAGVPAVEGPLSTLADLETELGTRLAAALGLSDGIEPPAKRAVGVGGLAAEERFFSAKRAFLRGDYATAMQLAEEALALEPELGEAIGFVGVCCGRMGRYDEAIAYNQRQQALAQTRKDKRLKVEALANLGSMHYFRGQYDAANDCLRRAVQAAERLGMTAELASIRNNLGFVLLQLGRQAEAEETYLRAVETHKRYGAIVALIGPYNGMGHVLREQKRYEEARGYFRRALGLAQESDDYVNMGIAHMNVGHCALLQGRLGEAKAELATALNILEQTSFWNGLARVYEYMADLNLRLSNCTAAVTCAERRIELARRHANRSMEIAAWRQKAEALRLAGRVDEAAACLAHTRVTEED
ncbi:MAG: tetratricopeptide repeat protein [Phycisphaerae bacterium]|jgi:tetratricopeptide (TPR) repeat protein